MRQPIHFVPILTTVFAFWFAWVILQRYRERRTGPHLLWWAAGAFCYGIGTITEASVTLFGWNPWLFRSWYVSGALLGGAPLAQGTVYLLLPRRVAHALTVLLVGVIATASVLVFSSPIDLTLVEPHRLTGAVMEWTWVRRFSPFVNLYAAAFLIGGALWSAWRFRSVPDMHHRVRGNVLIAVGALLPAIGGTATRFGYTEVLYFMEFVGLLIIWAGYRAQVSVPARVRASGSPGSVPALQSAEVGLG